MSGDISERKQAEANIHHLNERLEQRVAERTAELEQANASLRRENQERRLAESALREREARLQALLTSAGAILTIDEQGIIESANPAAEQLTGYTAQELLGQTIGILMPPPYRDEHPTYLSNYRRTGIRKIIGTTQELFIRHRDGASVPVELSVTEVSTGTRRLFTGVLRDIRKRKALEREVLEIAAREQQRLGQELHDGVGQELTGLALLADVLLQKLAHAPPEHQQLAVRITARLEQVHEEIRALSRGLVPMQMDAEGLGSALEDLAIRTQEETGVGCTFTSDPSVPIPDDTSAGHLFRIAQEAVSNALRHSQARHIALTLRDTATAVTLGIRDDGVGIPEESEGKSGLGIRLMQYRAGILGGSVQVRPAVGGGTFVLCTLPRRTRNDCQ